MPVKSALNILFLEDVPTDVEVVFKELKNGGLHFRMQQVETKEDFLYHLENHPPDLILSDHGLPHFDGFAALHVAKDKCPDVPFIFVTGSQDEHFVDQTFENGATDYVHKSRLDQLVPAIKRAHHHAAERRQFRKQIDALRETDERHRMLVESAGDHALCMLDPEGRVVTWNLGAEKVFGYRADEALGLHLEAFYSPEELEKNLPKRHLQLAASEGRFEEEATRFGKGGHRFSAQVIINPLRDSRGQFRGFSLVARDITRRKQAEEALARSEFWKRTILETARDAIVSIDFQGRFQEWNPAAERFFGYTRAEAVGQLVDELIVPSALREVYRTGLTEYLLTGACSLEGRPIQLTLRRKDHSEFPAEMDLSRMPTENPPHCTAVIRDISERKRIETVLRVGEDRYRLLIEGAKDYTIYMLDPEGRVASWNAGAESIEGYKVEEVIGKSFSMFFTPEDRKEGRPARILEKAKSEGVAFYERWQVRKDGSRFWSQRSICALRDANGQLLGFSKIGRDMTERKKAEDRIRRHNQQLEQRVSERTAQLEAANKELEAFSYSVSHDLRAPLRHITGYLEILQLHTQSRLNEEAQHSMQMIWDAARQMSELIDALLDFSRLGRGEMHLQQVNFNALVKTVQVELHTEAANRNIEWQIGDLPIMRGDTLMLRQAWINLISNALKFTRNRSPAKIEIGAHSEAGQVTFFIRDNGAGFSMAYAHKLFGVFQRLHRRSEFEGTGIGLANVQRIIARHGGRVWAEGVAGQGATFYFTLPAEPTKPAL
jgi:PAS domain S-box-containing protein